tara:strand:+ start:1166 stop:1453 length:288 start_codon:yes stop_codon:yes gene_type:complete
MSHCYRQVSSNIEADKKDNIYYYLIKFITEKAMNKDKKIPVTVRIERNWGEERVYPVCEISKIYAQIADTTTLTDRTRSLMKKLGYEFIVEVQKL